MRQTREDKSMLGSLKSSMGSTWIGENSQSSKGCGMFDESVWQSKEKKSAHLCEILSHFHLHLESKLLRLFLLFYGMCFAPR